MPNHSYEIKSLVFLLNRLIKIDITQLLIFKAMKDIGNYLWKG